MESQSLNWGILGTSFISGIMAEAILKDGQTKLYAVAGRSAVTLKEFSEKYGVQKNYQNYDELIRDSKVDIIYIALPNHLHHEFVIKAANAGKAILCEKSLSIDMPKTDAALAAVVKNKIFFAEGLMYLTHPIANAIQEIIQQNKIGEIRSIHGQYCAAIAQFVNVDSKGALYNLGCYPVSLMHLIMQEAFGDAIFNNYQIKGFGRRGVDGNICESGMTMQFTNGVVCQLQTAEDYGLHTEFTVLGSKASLQFISNPWLPEATGNQLVITPYEEAGETITITADGNGFLYQVRLIREALGNGQLSLQRPAVRSSDSRAIMQLLTDWEKSIDRSSV